VYYWKVCISVVQLVQNMHCLWANTFIFYSGQFCSKGLEVIMMLTSGDAFSFKDILFSVSLPPFGHPSCLEYLWPCALILLKTWRYIILNDDSCYRLWVLVLVIFNRVSVKTWVLTSSSTTRCCWNSPSRTSCSATACDAPIGTEWCRNRGVISVTSVTPSYGVLHSHGNWMAASS